MLKYVDVNMKSVSFRRYNTKYAKASVFGVCGSTTNTPISSSLSGLQEILVHDSY